MDRTLVRGEGLSKSFESGASSGPVLRHVDFAVLPGDRIALVGPSGSGKTTLLHLMGGIESPNSGSIEWPALGAAGEIRPKKVGIAFQGPSLLQPLTVLENVALPLLLSGASNSEARERASDLLERFALSSLDNSMPDEISGGQMQRAGLARALVVSPMLVLADEPTGQLDRATSERAVETLLSLIAPEAALVIATHDQQIAKHMNTTWKLSSGFLETEELLRSQ